MNPKSNKTTGAGIFAIVMGGLGIFSGFSGGGVDFLTDLNAMAPLVGSITGGIGLLAAKDNSVSHTQLPKK